jgi:hypothetical protein
VEEGVKAVVTEQHHKVTLEDQAHLLVIIQEAEAEVLVVLEVKEYQILEEMVELGYLHP